MTKFPQVSPELENSIIAILDKMGANPGILEKMRVRDKTLKDTIKDGSSRIINYWNKEGLLEYRDDSDKSWRKFSYFDRGFVHIISSLRDRGLPVVRIKSLRDFLYTPVTLSCPNELNITIFEIMFFLAMSPKETGNIYLFLGGDDEHLILSELDIMTNGLAHKISEFSTLLNMNLVFQARYGAKFKEEGFIASDLSKEIADVLYKAISNSDADEVIFKKDKDGNLTNIEEKFSGATSDFGGAHNIINDIGYGEISQNVVDGKVVHFNATRKHKV